MLLLHFPPITAVLTFGCGSRLSPKVHSSVIGRICTLIIMADIDWMQKHKLKAKSYFGQIYWLSVENAMTSWYYSVNWATRIRSGSKVKLDHHRLTA